MAEARRQAHWDRHHPHERCYCGHRFLDHNYPSDECGIRVGRELCWCTRFRLKPAERR
jgi:hypothetical protein